MLNFYCLVLKPQSGVRSLHGYYRNRFFYRYLSFGQILVGFPEEAKRLGVQHKLTDRSSLLQIVTAQAVLRRRELWFSLRTTYLSTEMCVGSAQGESPEKV